MNQVQTHKLYSIWVLLEGLPCAGLGKGERRDPVPAVREGWGKWCLPHWFGEECMQNGGVNELHKLGWAGTEVGGDRRMPRL